MPETLIKSRITPPRLRADIIHRARLIKQMQANIDKSLILICSSAGFGKTTLAIDFLKGTHYAWYYVSPVVNSFYSFFIHIIHSIRKISDKFSSKTLHFASTLQQTSALSKDTLSSIDELTGSFVNEFMECFDEDVTVLIDDLHNIDAQKNCDWLNYFFDLLFDLMPENLHFIITTRTMPGFNINKLKAKRRIFDLGTDDLMFDREEIVELLEKIYSINAAGLDIRVFQKDMNGWITGIHLILQAYGSEFRKLKHGNIRNYEDIFNYFAEDIFAKLDENTREFLLGTAVLEDFDPEICNAMLNIDYSEKIIDELLKKNIFIQHTAPHNNDDAEDINHYNYLELFRLFLLSKLSELKTKEETNSRITRLFNHFMSVNQFIPAVKYGLKAEEFRKVIPIISENYNSLFEKGHYDILWHWLGQIPHDILKDYAYMMYLKGLLYLYFRAKPTETVRYANEAMVLATSGNDIPLLVDCHILKTDAMLLLGKIENLKEDLGKVLDLKIGNVEKVKLLYHMSRVLYREGNSTYNEIVELLSEGINICNEENLDLLKVDMFTMLGNVYSDWGDPVKAVYYYEQALINNTDVYKVFRATNNIIYQYCQLGKYEKAKENIERAEELHNTNPSLLFKRYLTRSKAILRFEVGDYEESVRKFDELINIELKNNIKEYAATYFMWIGDCCYYMQRHDAALKNYEIASDYIDRRDRYRSLLQQFSSARLLMDFECKPEFEQTLLETLEFHEKNNIIGVKFQIEFFLAHYYLLIGSRDTALVYLKRSLETAAEKQYVSFFEQEAFISREVFDLAISNNLHKQFIKTIFQNVRDKLSYKWLSDDCKKRLASRMECLNDLKLLSFGRTEIWVRGKPIDEEKWVRKKSKLILAYMLAKPNVLLYKDKIVDMFLHETPIENIDKVFHNTVSNIRSAVKANGSLISEMDRSGAGKNGNSPQFIIYEDRVLSLNKDYYYDSDCIQFELLFNKAKSASASASTKIEDSVKAIELYKGEFMPGYYEPWCEEMRDNFSNMFEKLLENLTTLLFSEARYEETIEHASRLLECDTLHTDAYLKIIESHVRLGNIGSAKDKAAMMMKNYEQELGDKPEKHILDRINRIISG